MSRIPQASGELPGELLASRAGLEVRELRLPPRGTVDPQALGSGTVHLVGLEGGLLVEAGQPLGEELLGPGRRLSLPVSQVASLRNAGPGACRVLLVLETHPEGLEESG